MNVEEREWWLPGQSLDLEVVAEQSSLVCLLGGRSGGGGDIKFDPRIRYDSYAGISATHRPPVFNFERDLPERDPFLGPT